jgi:hypothetical protein
VKSKIVIIGNVEDKKYGTSNKYFRFDSDSLTGSDMSSTLLLAHSIDTLLNVHLLENRA